MPFSVVSRPYLGSGDCSLVSKPTTHTHAQQGHKDEYVQKVAELVEEFKKVKLPSAPPQYLSSRK